VAGIALAVVKSRPRPLGLRQLLEFAATNAALHSGGEDIERLSSARNDLVHGKKSPNRQELRRLANDIDRNVRALPVWCHGARVLS
jgi:hypothetical protein